MESHDAFMVKQLQTTVKIKKVFYVTQMKYLTSVINTQREEAHGGLHLGGLIFKRGIQQGVFFQTWWIATVGCAPLVPCPHFPRVGKTSVAAVHRLINHKSQS